MAGTAGGAGFGTQEHASISDVPDQVAESAQHTTQLHRDAVTWISIPILSSVAVFAFSCYTCCKLIKDNLGLIIICTAIALVAHIIPILLPLYWLFVIFLFLRRLSFFISNWEVIKAGIAVTLLSTLITVIQICGIRVMSGSDTHSPWLILGCLLPIGLSYVTRLVLDKSLKTLYKRGYTSESAMTIMGAVPLVLIGLLMPLLKIGTFFDHASPHFEHGGDIAHLTHTEGVVQPEVNGSGLVTVAEVDSMVFVHSDLAVTASANGAAVQAAWIGHSQFDVFDSSHSAIVADMHTGHTFLVSEHEVHMASETEVAIVVEDHGILESEHTLSYDQEAIHTVDVQTLTV